MGIAREDKRLDAQVYIFLHARRHRVWIAHQGCARATAHQANPCPQIRAELQLVTLAIVQRLHAMLTHRLAAALEGLGRLNSVITHILDQIMGGVPGLAGGFAHDNVQANAKANLMADFFGITAPVDGGIVVEVPEARRLDHSVYQALSGRQA